MHRVARTKIALQITRGSLIYLLRNCTLELREKQYSSPKLIRETILIVTPNN